MGEESDPGVAARARPSRPYSTKCKPVILGEDEQLNKLNKDALLRREGWYTSLISWHKQRNKSVLTALAKPRGGTPANVPAIPASG